MNEEVKRPGLIGDEDIFLDAAALSLTALDHPDTDLTSHHDLVEAIAIRPDVAGRDAASGTCAAASRAGSVVRLPGRYSARSTKP